MGRSNPPRRRLSLRAVSLVVLGALAVGCAQIIGADGDRELSPLLAVDDGGSGQSDDPSGDGATPGTADPSACAPNEKRCDGACVPKSVEYGCGADDCAPCSLPNVAKMVCKDDQCAAATCQPGFGACGEPTEGCAEDLTSPATCTGCLTACNVAEGQVCSPSGCGADCGGLFNCDGACVDRDTNPNHCGGCGEVCPGAANGDAACEAGACAVKCRPGYDHCDGDPNTCQALTVFYRDADGDGWGVTSEVKRACNAAAAGAGWATRGGDCHDGNKQVNPGQKLFFNEPYASVDGKKSYDYNCDGAETESPGTSHVAGACTCGVEGFRVANAGRGAGTNDYCGSRAYVRCQPEELVLRARKPNGPALCLSYLEDRGTNPCR